VPVRRIMSARADSSGVFSIDQNSHSLWDSMPKLQALARAGLPVTHFIEDVDVAFTALGASPGEAVRIARERFHRSGGQDWGAALFYSEFLGRLPVEIRDWEPHLGQAVAAMAHRLGRPLNDLYDEFSPSDNWQLIGPSYAGDREHHRLIGDLTVSETSGAVRELLAMARRNCLEAFPSSASQARVSEWFDREQARAETLLARCAEGRLVDLYRLWMGEHLGGTAELRLTSMLLATGADAHRTALLEIFTRDYALAAALYNEALAESGVPLRPLRVKEGELPFFAVLRRAGRLVRTAAYLNGSEFRAGDRTFALRDGGLPLEELRKAGIECLAGKAALLVLQARYGPAGRPLALPHRGSLYMPAAHCLARRLQKAGLLPETLQPVLRVRFRLLDRLAGLDTPIRLPAHLAAAMGRQEVPAHELARHWRDLSADAARRLDAFRDGDARLDWQRRTLPDLFARLDALDARRRELAERDPKSAEIRRASHEHKAVQAQILDRTLRRIAADWQLKDLDYWDSRGALLPWAVALGGEKFYNELLAQAELSQENPQDAAP